MAQAFEGNDADVTDIGLAKRCVQRFKNKGPIYHCNKVFRVKVDVEAFFDEHAIANPCKSFKKCQLTLSVKELHKEFLVQHPGQKVSLRTFHRLKPKDVASVRKLKFRQCMCEICVNPKLKLTRLSHYMKKKCDSVRELLGESVCAFDVTPKLECVDRKCGHCGVERVRERLGIELRESLNQNGSWKSWEHVKEGKSYRMDRVQKSGSVQDCLNELMQELGSLYRHVFNAEWQRKQLQLLKADLPDGWAVAYLDFAENFLCKFQDEVQSAHWSYEQVPPFQLSSFTGVQTMAVRN